MIEYFVRKVQDIFENIMIQLFGGQTYEKIKIE